MNRIIMAVGAVAVLAAASPATGQDRWAFELRGGVAFPTEDIGNDALGRGMGFDGTLRYRFLPHLALYGGWDWIGFSPDELSGTADLDLEETGYTFGLRFEHPLAGDPGLAGWVRAGATYDHLEIEVEDGDIIADSGHGFGWEAAAGVAIGAGARWSVTPGVRYRSLSRDLEIGGVTAGADLRYVMAELGLAVRF